MLKLKMAPFAPDSLKRQQRRLFEFSRAFTIGLQLDYYSENAKKKSREIAIRQNIFGDG
jgi:hypothetical protein